ncbi:hypothetical protein JW933_07750, partial [candidate division FCPU426 bacterium]|nr:hypothetical protein [candidate division FCPU426 bacterium]
MTSERGSKKERETGPLTMRSLKKIITIMNRAKLTELNIEQDGVKIHLRRGYSPGEMADPQLAGTPAMTVPASMIASMPAAA